jgi:DNA polymerase-3 subunit gamma/tau
MMPDTYRKYQPVASRILDYYRVHPLPPLLIFTGPRGTGKLDAALQFIQQQLCQAGTACGTCSDCRLFQQIGGEAHPDFIQFPADKVAIGDAKNPEPFTVRWLLNTRLPFAPYHARRRFVLFPAADRINHEAETALLKTLEEPPDHTRFIFITESLDFLKETIVSRGVHVPFHRLSLQALEAQTGIRDVHDLEILGGSFELLDLIQSESYRRLKTAVDDGLSHQLGMLDLEAYVRDESKRKDEMKQLKYEYEDFLQVFALMLLQKTRRMMVAGDIAESVHRFLAGLRMAQGGMLPFHLSRLFFDLHRIIFETV